MLNYSRHWEGLMRDGYRVIGIRHGWGGLVDYVRDDKADNTDNVLPLSEAIVNRAGRTGGGQQAGEGRNGEKGR